jgi:hypothetical protein
LPLLLAVIAFWRALAPAQITPIPATHVYPVSVANTNQLGFIWNVSQVANSEPNQLAWAEGQLAGLEGPNEADTNAVGIATGPAAPPNPITAPITFYITNVINLSRVGGSSFGNFTPDDQMPGLPGAAGNGTDNTAAEILTYLNLPAGTITMGVNSDDGFRVTIGGAIPQDKASINVGQFDGGRGSADTIFQFQVAQAGLYAARCLYENGGGDANIEWFTVLDGLNGTNKVLINDIANGGIPAFSAITVSPAYISSIVPGVSAVGVVPNAGVHLQVADGSTPVASSSMVLAVDGTVVSPTIMKNGNISSIDYNLPSPWLPQSSHSATFSYVDGTLKVTNAWSWMVQYYINLDANWRITTVDTNKPGFYWNIFANLDANNVANSNERAELDLSLQAVDSTGGTLLNYADPAAVYAAAGPGVAPNPLNAIVHFEIPGTINFDIAKTNMPGAPSVDGTTDGQAAEVLTYLSLPAGVVAMQVDSDDGWRLYAGARPADVFGRAVVGEHNDGTGPVSFSFLAPQAGMYPFRLVWENGTGGSHLIWSTINNAGSTVLVNDVAHGGIAAYRALVSGTATQPTITGVTPIAALHQLEVPNTNVFIALVDGTAGIVDASVTLTVDGKSVTNAPQRTGSYLTISDSGTAFPGCSLAGDVHSATLTFSNTAGITRTQTWTFNNIENLILPANPVVSENFDSYPEATSVANTVPPGWTAWNFTAENTAGWDLTQKASDSFKNWIIISNTTMLGVEPSALSYNQNQTINGQPITNFASGKNIWAQSDGRNGPQVQFCTSAPFNLSSITNPVLMYSSIMRMSSGGNAQADGIEYSIDGGNTWLPGIIYVTIAYGSEANVMLNPDGSIDAVRTLNAPLGSIYGSWNDIQTGQPKGGNFGSGLAEAVTPALSGYIAPRSDTTTKSTKVDGFRLPMASRQKSVILRFYQLGNCSWWWGVDNLAFYDIAPPYVVAAPPQIDSIRVSGGQVTVTWSNGGTLQYSASLSSPVWTSTSNSSGSFTEPVTAANRFYRVSR